MKTILATAAALLTISVANVQASTTNLVTFGDSLVDSGNVRVLVGESAWNDTVYPNGQFTSGDTWATRLGLSPSLAGGTNYAYGGAQSGDNGDFIPDLISQVVSFLGESRVGESTSAAIWVGGNDFLALSDEPTESEIAATISKVISNITYAVQKLGHRKVGQVLVLGLPDFGILPRFASDPQDAAEASFLTSFYNDSLQNALAGVDLAYPGTDVSFFDIESFFQEIVGLVPEELISVPCLSDPVGCAENPKNYLLYDNIHPSAWVHALLADAVAEELGVSVAAVPLPATAPLLLFSLGGAAVMLRRRKSRA